MSTKWQSDLADLQSYAKLLVTLWPLWPKLTKVEPRPTSNLQQERARTRRPRGNTNPGAPPALLVFWMWEMAMLGLLRDLLLCKGQNQA